MGHSVCGDYTWCSASHMQDLITKSMSPLGSLLGRRSARQHLGGACRLQAQAGKGRALHVMLFFENFIRALLICNEVRSRYYQRALLVYQYPSIKTTDLGSGIS